MRYHWLLLLGALLFATAAANLNVVTREEAPSGNGGVPSNGAAVDEVIVESSLYIKPKPAASARKTRSIQHDELANAWLSSLAEHKRVKRTGPAPRLAGKPL